MIFNKIEADLIAISIVNKRSGTNFHIYFIQIYDIKETNKMYTTFLGDSQLLELLTNIASAEWKTSE